MADPRGNPGLVTNPEGNTSRGVAECPICGDETGGNGLWDHFEEEHARQEAGHD